MAFEKTQGAGNHADIASKSFLHDCWPNTYVEVATAATAAKVDMASLAGDDPAGTPVTGIDLRGKRVWLQAVTEDCDVLRGDHVATMVAGAGIPLTTSDNPYRSGFVDPGDGVDNEITFIAGGVGALRFYYSSDL